jgi:hypothetical protein
MFDVKNAASWAEVGCEIVRGPIGRQHGPNKSGYRAYPREAYNVELRNIGKVVAHFGEAPLVAGINGTSWKVACQGVNRRMFDADIKTPEADILLALYATIKGIRVGGRRTVVKVYVLPNGVTWEGTDESSYQLAIRVALVDGGLDGPTAERVSKLYTFENAKVVASRSPVTDDENDEEDAA